MGKVTSFSIHFDPPQAVFFAGSSICGYVTVNLKKPMKMKGIKVKFTGSLLFISFIRPIIILLRYLSESNEQSVKASETSLCRYKIPIYYMTYRLKNNFWRVLVSSPSNYFQFFLLFNSDSDFIRQKLTDQSRIFYRLGHSSQSPLIRSY